MLYDTVGRKLYKSRDMVFLEEDHTMIDIRESKMLSVDEDLLEFDLSQFELVLAVTTNVPNQRELVHKDDSYLDHHLVRDDQKNL